MNKAQRKARETETLEYIYTMLDRELEERLERLDEAQKELNSTLSKDEVNEFELEFLKGNIEEQEIKIKTFNRVLETIYKIM